MAESIYIKELNKGIRETANGLREVTVKLTPLEEALPEKGSASGCPCLIWLFPLFYVVDWVIGL